MSRRKERGKTKSSTANVSDYSGATDTRAVTEFVSRSEEVSQRRVESMKQKLRDLERQMEVLEAEMKKANDSSLFDMHQSDWNTPVLEPASPFFSS